VEACPKAAIIMSQAYELAEYRREDLTYDKERLIKTGK
jgi:formate hydrogenlyase subunit 6/NADH:ubiquinone oxidoreductase subunit I